jgi:tRNA nucleotidyltransferase (CCA-adding enzyme)
MTSLQKVSKDVLRQIRPNKAQKSLISRLSRKTLLLVQKAAKKYKASAMLAGSVTRGTWLPDKLEFDVFILFPEKMKEKQMEQAGLGIGKAVIAKLKGRHEISYAEHPYVSGIVDGVDIDIVPAYAVASAEKIKSAVDRTPFHVRYIEKRMKAKLADDVILLKRLLKANGMYGADAKTEGFSGYVCELLTINYGGFQNLLKAAAKWKVGEIVDMEKRYGKKDVQDVAKKFKEQALVLIDPTDKNRNTAAALSAYNFAKFRKISSEILKKPDEQMFFGKTQTTPSADELNALLAKRGTEFTVVKFIPPKAVPDVLWPQLRKFGERIQTILEESKYEFKVLNQSVFTDESYIAAVALEMEVFKLPNVQKRIGPSVFDADDSRNFLEKYKDSEAGPYVEGNNWAVEIERRFVTPRDKIQDSLAKPLEELVAKGVPKTIAERIANGFEIIGEPSRIAEEGVRNPQFGAFLRKFFEKEKLVREFDPRI